MTTSTQSTNQPIDRVQFGRVESAIWPNVDKTGRTRYSATFKRRYQDQHGDWKATNTFNRDDLLTLAKTADATYARIFELQQADREQDGEQDAWGANTTARVEGGVR